MRWRPLRPYASARPTSKGLDGFASTRCTRPDAQRLANLHHAHASLVEALDALLQLDPGHAERSSSWLRASSFSAQLDALGFGPRQPRIDSPHNHGALELGEDAAHLKHRPARWGGRVNGVQ